MHIKDIINYVKNEINFSKEFCEDNVFITLRIEPIERIIENLEQKDKDNLSYAKDLAEMRYKYNTLKKKIEDLEPILKPHYIPKEKVENKIEELNDEEKEIYKKDIGNNELYRLKIIDETRKVLQELLEEK